MTTDAAPRARARLEARGVARPGRARCATGASTWTGRWRALRAAGLWSLMVEGGSELLGALLAARLFDQVALFRAPLLLGGRGSRPAFGGPDPARLADAVRLTPRSPLLPAAQPGPLAGRARRRRLRALVPGGCAVWKDSLAHVHRNRRGGRRGRGGASGGRTCSWLRIAGARRSRAGSRPGRLDRGERLLPDRRGDRRRTASPASSRAETLARTGFAERLRPGALVNLERPLRADGRFDGHIVQGHVDGLGEIVGPAAARATAAELTVAVPPALERYLVEKGSVAVDGISLTVAALRPGGFSVAIIPYTLDRTNLRAARPGDRVNLEIDVIAKYVERLLAPASSRA